MWDSSLSFVLTMIERELIGYRYCVGSGGDDVQIVPEGGSATTNQASDDNESETTVSPTGENCHFHAGVEYVNPSKTPFMLFCRSRKSLLI